ncbi:MAG: PA14 domain-containing protein [Verrucomicrobiales bacterium]|nr:PA14 domain-containing protein [Verrucomicrobiales bacterium]
MKTLALKLGALVSITTLAYAQPAILWEAFNDYRPGDLTSPNATTYDLRVTDDGGVLKNIQTGADLEASVIVVPEGDALPDDFGANSPVNPGSPADLLFNGKVHVGNDGLPGLRSSANIKLILNFNGLDPSKRYNFRGTVSRGGNYNDRWSVFGITGADAYVAAHVDGSNNQNIFTKTTFPTGTLESNQVALNTGDNKPGSLVGWDNIEPGADGTFSIEAQQYTGPAPFGNPSAAAYGYGFNAIYLAKVESTGSLRITENPANQNVPAGTTTTLRVAATSPQPIDYQWQKAAPGTANFTDISGATQADYTTPTLTAADNGTKFRVIMTSGGVSTTSGEATLTVDATIPSLTEAHGSINFNSIYVTFSEAMKLDMLAQTNNYQVSSGLAIASVSVLEPTFVRLLLGSTQNLATTYTVTVNNIEDIAGNKVAANSSRSFIGFSLTTNVVGLEIWKDITGGAVADLTNHVRYPSEPTVDYVTTTFDSTNVFADGPNNTYGGRFRAWITPEETGDYEFFLRADDSGDLRISSDDKFDDLDNPERVPDAMDTIIGDPFQEPGFDLSTSAPIRLERGKRYAIQASWKEGNGNDHLQVAWRKVGDTTPADQLQPIPIKFLSFYGPTAVNGVEPRITRIAFENGTVTIAWTGMLLQSSTDLKTWTDEMGLTSPTSVVPQGIRFYRVKN